MEPWDIFISHASEDKATFVEPLARRLEELAVRVWYDQFILMPGDSISEKIGEGLAKSRCGLLVFSKSFMEKKWTTFELSGLVNRFVEEGTRLIPVWLGVNRSDVSGFNPALADLFSLKGDPEDINSCAMEILRVVRPQLHENMSALNAIQGGEIKISRVEDVDPAKLDSGPIRHHDLPASMLVRIQNVWFSLRDVYSMSLAKSIENFQRDLRPERELEVMERIAGAIQIATDILENSDFETRKEVFRILLQFSFGNNKKVFDDVDTGAIEEGLATAAATAWLNVVPDVTVSDVDESGV